MLKRVHARTRGVPPRDDGLLFAAVVVVVSFLWGLCPPITAVLLIIINLGFLRNCGADIILSSYDSGLCCFIGSIIPGGLRPLRRNYVQNIVSYILFYFILFYFIWGLRPLRRNYVFLIEYIICVKLVYLFLYGCVVEKIEIVCFLSV